MASVFVFLALLLVMVAGIGSLAAYRSKKIAGSEVVNSMRLVRAVGYFVVAMVIGVKLFYGADQLAPMLLGVVFLAIGDAVSYVDRITELMRYEQPGDGHGGFRHR
jgi:hypothetical protein